MVLALEVDNLAIIEQASLDLGPGFTVFTGETGAGKSLLIDAMELALGGRGDSGLVRTGAERATVSLLVDVSSNPAALTRAIELGFDVDEGQIVVQREVTAEGRSTVRINGRPSTVGLLRELAAHLVDLHGQHEHQALLNEERQTGFLDSWIGAQAGALLAEVGERWATVESLRKKVAEHDRSLRGREQRIDMLRFQVREITEAAPTVGESAELVSALERAKHAERLSGGVGRALEALADRDGASVETLGRALKELEPLALTDAALEPAVSGLREVLATVEEVVRSLRTYFDSIDLEPAQAERCAERLDALRRLFRKYGEGEQAVLDHLETAKAELAALTTSESDAAEWTERLALEEEALANAAARLSELRQAKAAEFASIVESEIRELAMPKARFVVRVQPRPIDATGADHVSFLFSANPGDPPRPLGKVASGGELSRVMLAIKVAGAGRAGVPTLVFDEVDTGLSGQAASVTARKMARLGETRQVLVITHLPQIAGRASFHYKIEKREQDGRSLTQVTKIDGEERAREVARLLAGDEIGDKALAGAMELLGIGASGPAR
jgi:DNA repair protein RecN (Recombination protein N)